MRQSLGSSSALVDFSNFEIWRMAIDMEGALGGTIVQTEICLRPRKLQRHPLDFPNQQSGRESHRFSFRAAAYLHWSIWSKPIRIYATRGARDALAQLVLT